MLKKMLASALFAGLATGVIAAVMHVSLLVPLIVEAEKYETGVLVHFGQNAPRDAAVTAGAQPSVTDTSLWNREKNPLHRGILTVGAELVTYTGFALLLVALFGVAEKFGHSVTARQGLLWGLAGFISLHVAPAVGLPPETPGIPAAAIAARQAWWLATALATASALGLIAFGKDWRFYALAILLLIVPHIIGAPHMADYQGVVPPALEGLFAGRSIAVAAANWGVLGLLTAWFWRRQHPT